MGSEPVQAAWTAVNIASDIAVRVFVWCKAGWITGRGGMLLMGEPCSWIRRMNLRWESAVSGRPTETVVLDRVFRDCRRCCKVSLSVIDSFMRVLSDLGRNGRDGSGTFPYGNGGRTVPLFRSGVTENTLQIHIGAEGTRAAGHRQWFRDP